MGGRCRRNDERGEEEGEEDENHSLGCWCSRRRVTPLTLERPTSDTQWSYVYSTTTSPTSFFLSACVCLNMRIRSHDRFTVSTQLSLSTQVNVLRGSPQRSDEGIEPKTTWVPIRSYRGNTPCNCVKKLRQNKCFLKFFSSSAWRNIQHQNKRDVQTVLRVHLER